MSRIKHGGNRKGAGRKPLPVQRKAITVRLLPAEVDKLNAICKAKERSQATQISEWIKRARL